MCSTIRSINFGAEHFVCARVPLWMQRTLPHAIVCVGVQEYFPTDAAWMVYDIVFSHRTCRAAVGVRSSIKIILIPPATTSSALAHRAKGEKRRHGNRSGNEAAKIFRFFYYLAIFHEFAKWKMPWMKLRIGMLEATVEPQHHSRSLRGRPNRWTETSRVGPDKALSALFFFQPLDDFV